MISEEELRVFKGRCGKILLEYIQRLPKSKIEKMHNKLRNCGMKLEHAGVFPIIETRHKESKAPIRTRSGYIYR